MIEIQRLKDFLHVEFKIKDFGLLHYFLGMEILRDENGIIISQRKYILDLLAEFDISHLHSVSSPMDPSCKLTADSGKLMSDPTIYRHLIGKLNYLTHTRPDLCYAILSLNQFMQQPSEKYFTVALRVLCYLKGSPNQGIFFTASHFFTISAFCDAD